LKTKTQLDTQTTVDSLRKEVREFMQERNWEQYHSPKNLGMSIAIEAAEIMEHFQWYSSEESRKVVEDKQFRAEVTDEVADVLIYCLTLANQLDIDVSTAVRSKLERNRSRYPIGYMPTRSETSS
jgi:NTP pyrophosphatase (non-canonical NTP hydrolase)